jgi:hypothetical protein
MNRAGPGGGKVKDFFSALRWSPGSLMRERHERSGIEPYAGKNKGVLFLDTTLFVVSLCVVALGVLLSYILEQRHHAGKKQEN